MSTWGIGDKHDSDEMQALKEQLRVKDAQIATLNGQLMKKDDDIKDIKSTYNDVADKLRREADRALDLEAKLNKHKEDIQNERVTRQNTETALSTAQEKLKAAELATQELHATLDTLSSSANSASSDKDKLGRENATLQARIRELQREIAAKEQSQETLLARSHNPPSGSSSARNLRRTSSVSDVRVKAMERDLADAQTRAAQQSAELQDAKARLSRTQEALVQMENEKIALERRMQKELAEVRELLEERDDELQALRAQGGEDAAAREANLLERLDEELRRAEALESELARATGGQRREKAMMQSELDRALVLIEKEKKKVKDAEARMAGLVNEKEEALEAKDQACQAVRDLEQQITQAEQEISELRAEAAHTATPPSPDSQTAATVERLLNAIERLRGERDQLRRDFDFLSAESKFAVQDLQAKLAAAISDSSTDASATVEEDWKIQLDTLQQRCHERRLRALQNEKTVTVFALVIQHAENERAEYLERVEGLLVDLDVAHARLQQAHAELEAKSAREDGLQAALEESQSRMQSMQSMLDDATQKLQLAEAQINKFNETVARVQEEASRVRDEREEIDAARAHTESRLADVTQALANSESARDSLALQLRHTEQDLEVTRKELAEADERHGAQLSAMSAGHSNVALRREIEVLQDRVLRRTEQIGGHQRDIKRLETNLRLHEERVVELTAELEEMTGEKEALVEDCRTTRDERNEALGRCELLEEKVELLEEERDNLQVVVSSAAEREQVLSEEIKKGSLELEEQRSQQLALQSRLSELNEERAQALGNVARLEEERSTIVEALEDRTNLCKSLAEEVHRSRLMGIQATVALATIHKEMRFSTNSLRRTHQASLTLQATLDELRHELDGKAAQLSITLEQLEILQQQHAGAAAAAIRLSSDKEKIEQTLGELRSTNTQLQSLNKQYLQKLAEAEDRLANGSENSLIEQELRDELASVQAKHDDEVRELQNQLSRTSAELHDAQQLLAESAASFNEVKESLSRANEQLEEQLAAVREHAETASHSEAELTDLRLRHQNEIDSLQEQLRSATAQFEQTTKIQRELEAQQEALQKELTDARLHVSAKAQEYEDLESQLSRVRSSQAEEIKSLQSRLDLSTAQLQSLEQSHTESEARYVELMRASAEVQEQLQGQVASANDELECLKASLQKEIELNVRNQKMHDMNMKAAREQRDKALQELQEEKTGLEYETTTLQAEIQKMKSLHRHLESQVKDSEKQIAALKADLENADSERIHADKECKAAEATLSMREIQHEQTVTALRREISSLRAEPKLEEKIAELEERNAEMEELLRSKCAEIEENDDRFIELLKERKKLTARVESLARKLHALQTKAAPASEAVPAPNPPEASTSAPTQPSKPPAATAEPPRRSLALARSTTPVASLPAARPTTPNTRARLAMASSSQSRPKTPEAKVSQQPVPRHRTPEPSQPSSAAMNDPAPAPSLTSSSSSSTSIGQKRRLPDDFDDGKDIPVQVFTADSVPVVEPTTPRARSRGLRPGFTPVRNPAPQASSSQVVIPLMREAATAAPLPPMPLPAVIADVTNSPRGKSQGEKTVKRGWLGRIRNAPGGTAQSSRAGSSRPGLSDRNPR